VTPMISNLARLWVTLIALVASSLPARAGDSLKVVTTLPDLADLTAQIGGERVQITSLCRGKENPHAFSAKPSHLVALSKADLFVQVGLSLETAFVPGLLEGCRNPRIQPGRPGFVNCSAGWPALDVPSSLSRQGGDLHPEGNPHMNLDPRGGRWIADRVLAGLCAVDPASKELFTARHGELVKKLDEATARWSALAAAWKGAPVVTYHQEFDYLIAAYGLARVGTIESKPGIPPTPNHVAELVEAMKRAQCRTVLTAIWSNNDSVARVAEAAGAKVVELPNMCGGIAGTDSWIAMMDLVHQRLAAALAPAEARK
jgi:zinc/manganese transport system substrate-binding protein